MVTPEEAWQQKTLAEKDTVRANFMATVVVVGIHWFLKHPHIRVTKVEARWRALLIFDPPKKLASCTQKKCISPYCRHTLPLIG